VIGRDKNATWQSVGSFCSERGWSKQRVIWELQNKRLLARTMPPGYEPEIDWHSIWFPMQFNLETSTINPVGPDLLPVEIEVMPADALPTPSPPAPMAASSSSSRKNVSEAELKNCILAIKTERPMHPPDEEDLWKEVEKRLDAEVPRDRIRQTRAEVAPDWKLPPGRPRKPAQ
jgi:hypothetical protein